MPSFSQMQIRRSQPSVGLQIRVTRLKNLKYNNFTSLWDPKVCKNLERTISGNIVFNLKIKSTES